MEPKFDIDDLLENRLNKSSDKSIIMMTLGSRLNYNNAKIIEMYTNWKKFD